MIRSEQSLLAGAEIGTIAAHILEHFGAPLRLADVGRVFKCEDRTARKRLEAAGVEIKPLCWPGELARVIWAAEQTKETKTINGPNWAREKWG